MLLLVLDDFFHVLNFTDLMDKIVVLPPFCPWMFFTTRGQNRGICMILSSPKGPKPPNKIIWEPKLGPGPGPGPKSAARAGLGPGPAALFGPGPGPGPNLGSQQILFGGFGPFGLDKIKLFHMICPGSEKHPMDKITVFRQFCPGSEAKPHGQNQCICMILSSKCVFSENEQNSRDH